MRDYTSPINIHGNSLMQMCVIKAATFKNTNGIHVTFSINSSSYCFMNAYADTTKKHKDDPSVETIAKGRLPVQ